MNIREFFYFVIVKNKKTAYDSGIEMQMLINMKVILVKNVALQNTLYFLETLEKSYFQNKNVSEYGTSLISDSKPKPY